MRPTDWIASASVIQAVVILAIVGCSPREKATVPTTQNGWLAYSDSRASQTISCDGRSILLAGNRSVLTLTGDCRTVRITGEHNDITISTPPGASIEITGAHNDVTWRATTAGIKPTLLDHGVSNDFHRGEE